ncbi:hypothetical protein [Kribbella sp. NPDC048915]|uniref:hypothetical protein n=1 Tax=Kribbella sp. NPDC048915 TaxID=3155148 RepID=UPI0034059C68
MKLQRFAFALAGAGLLATAVASAPAAALGQADPVSYFSQQGDRPVSTKAAIAANPCISAIGLPTAAGTMQEIDATPAKPPRATAYAKFPFVSSRLDATWYFAANANQTQFYYYGLLVQGASLYRHTTYIPTDETKPPVPTFKRVGSGWTNFKAIATSNYSVAQPRHAYLYGLNTNNSLYRYAIVGAGFKSLGPIPGFRGFKAMTVIAETPTYDTLLMTTTAGALWTAHIPIAAGAKPVMKLIRSSGFAAYESLVAQSCGTRGGTLLVGVDHNTKSAYQYALSHANGTATAVTSYGKIPGVFDGVSHVSLTTHYDQLVGE